MNCILIGLGMVADTHIAALQASHTVALCGVMTRNAAKAESIAKTHDVKALHTLDAVIEERPDFVIVATPPDARLNIVTACAAAKIPVLMEKPIERTLSAARDIVQLCDAADIPLGVLFQHRAREASQALKNAINDSKLGAITHAEIRVPWWRDQAYYDAPGRGTYARDGGGVMITQAIHTLDLALWLMGPVTQVQSLMRTTPLHKLEAEDWAGALLEFGSGAVATLTATTAAFPGSAESITVHGTNASAHLAKGVVTIAYQDGTTDTVGASATTGGGADPMAFTHDWHQTLIEDFANAVLHGRAPMAPGDQALRTHAVIHAMEQANVSGQRTQVID